MSGGPGVTASAVDDGSFAAALDRLGPFEAAPRMAVAVSGGSDSMALTLFADRWASARGGSVVGLTVDHRLRPEAAEEAAEVGRWLAARGIGHETLAWDAPRPGQEAARRARYRLLEAACERLGILHLLTGHTSDDQAETVLLRLAKGSGPDGLAGMAAVRESFGIRLLRPLLGVARADLRAALAAEGQPWIDDPSNDSPRYARGRLRAATAGLAVAGLDARSLAVAARRAGRARAALETAAAGLAARVAVVEPEGWVTLDPDALARSPDELAARVLARALAVVGGGEHPPPPDRVDALLAALRTGALRGGRTLAGCRIVPGRTGRLAVMREPAGATARLPVGTQETLWWDRRFRVVLSQGGARDEPGPERGEDLEVRALGDGARAGLRRTGLPAAVVRTLPALWRGDRLAAVPDLVAGGSGRGGGPGPATFRARFVPAEPLAGPPFAVV